MKNVLERTTWTQDRQYVIKARAKFAHPLIGGALVAARADVMVFRGDPEITRRREIFYALSQLHSHDLLDELQNAERIARDFIDLINDC